MNIARKSFDPVGAAYFEGNAPVPQDVSGIFLSEDSKHLEIELKSGAIVTWPAAEVRRLIDHAEASGDWDTVLRWTGDPVARLFLRGRALRKALPNPDRRAPPQGRGRLVAWAVAAVAAVVFQIGVLVPIMANQLAPMIPVAGQRALGEATLEQIQTALAETDLPVPMCTKPEGLAALRKMEARLTEQLDLDTPLTVSVMNYDMINAFALPGGYVILFRSLVEEAETAEEVAAVLGHEIGHVVSRDPTRHALRSAGSIGILGLLFGDFAGGAVVLFLAEQLIDAHYSQDAEAEADAFARDLLERANVDPSGLATFFRRLQEEFGDAPALVGHFMAHPTLADRIAASENAGGGPYSPILTEEEWLALRGICPPERYGEDGFF